MKDFLEDLMLVGTGAPVLPHSSRCAGESEIDLDGMYKPHEIMCKIIITLFFTETSINCF